MALPRSPLSALSDRQRGSLALVVGTILLLNPLYVTALHVGSTQYTYRTAPIHAEDGALVVEGVGEHERVRTRIAGIGCTALHRSRACKLDRRILATGPVRANESYERGPEYVRLDGRYYRRVVQDRKGNGPVRLALVNVTAQEALDEAAIPEFSLTWPGRIAMLTGSVTTTYPLTHAEHIVRTEDGYRLIYLASFTYRGAGGGQYVFYLGGIIAGSWPLVKGYRRLPAETS